MTLLESMREYTYQPQMQALKEWSTSTGEMGVYPLPDTTRSLLAVSVSGVLMADVKPNTTCMIDAEIIAAFAGAREVKCV